MKSSLDCALRMPDVARTVAWPGSRGGSNGNSRSPPSINTCTPGSVPLRSSTSNRPRSVSRDTGVRTVTSTPALSVNRTTTRAGVAPSAGLPATGTITWILPSLSGAITTIVALTRAFPKPSTCVTVSEFLPGLRFTPMYSHTSACFSVSVVLRPTRWSLTSSSFTTNEKAAPIVPLTVIDVCANGKVS